ncbi:hypothetical protein NDU88_002240 [Pleurodeles waltl]|uniref:Uncharacterized protein n=1 Tax=Pleurodeles waltl TaxID=8319 RepID=A0AAV7VEB8_PLEWA|nr:hypothetical protein NDU88_002240 [Pleurodeles waltl]
MLDNRVFCSKGTTTGSSLINSFNNKPHQHMFKWSLQGAWPECRPRWTLGREDIIWPQSLLITLLQCPARASDLQCPTCTGEGLRLAVKHNAGCHGLTRPLEARWEQGPRVSLRAGLQRARPEVMTGRGGPHCRLDSGVVLPYPAQGAHAALRRSAPCSWGLLRGLLPVLCVLGPSDQAISPTTVAAA